MASEPIIELGAAQVLWLLVMVGGVLVLGAAMRLGYVKDVSIATVRATLQLLAVGLVIGWVFEQRVWYAVLGLLVVMTVIAGVTGARRTQANLPGLTWRLCAVLGCVTALTLGYLAWVVVRVETWDPRYLIPLGGMVLGNSMTAGTLAVERLIAELKNRQRDVEALLALGASPSIAAGGAVRSAIRAAMTPTINTMMVVGVVTLPGMMTGQMLGGTGPLQAALYQLMILVAIVFCAALTASAMTWIVYRRFFSAGAQLDRVGLEAIR